MKAWTTKQLADKAGVSIWLVYKEIEKGKFPNAEKFGSVYAIPYEDGIEWLQKRGITIEDESQE